jgi:hypothetical protein
LEESKTINIPYSVLKWGIIVFANDLVESFIEVKLPDDEFFHIVKETLTRIGISSKNKKVLWQSCHILHKKGRYFIVHFKEILALDGKETNFSEDDTARRNTIANLLEEWELITLVDPSKSEDPVVPISEIEIVPYKDKKQWDLRYKYRVGRK